MVLRLNSLFDLEVQGPTSIIRTLPDILHLRQILLQEGTDFGDNLQTGLNLLSGLGSQLLLSEVNYLLDRVLFDVPVDLHPLLDLGFLL